MATLFSTEKFILNSNFMIILPIKRVKNTVENVDYIFLKIVDELYFLKVLLITQT